MGYRDILKHYYSGVSIRTVGSGTSSGGGLFSCCAACWACKNQKELRKILLK